MNPHPTKGPAPFLPQSKGSPVANNINHSLMPNNNRYGQTKDGDDVIMHVRIPSDVVKRIKLRAGWTYDKAGQLVQGTAMSVDQYAYENIVYRSLVDSVY